MSEREGKPISGKYEIENGAFQLSVRPAAVALTRSPAVTEDDGGTVKHAPRTFTIEGEDPAGELPPPPGYTVDIRDRTARSLYKTCVAAEADASSWCDAYLMGVADTLTAFRAGGNKSGICGVEYTIEQLAENFITWARANEALLDIDMLPGATLAFEQRWPCGERQKSKH